MNLKELGEFGFIEHIKQSFSDLIPQGCQSIGDDCAIVPMNGDCNDPESQSMVITTDMLVEDVHFLRNKISARELGAKSIAVNLSDIASMGASPYSTFLSIALPSDIDSQWAMEFIDGYRSWGIPLLGGDTTSSKNGVVINITAMGIVKNKNIKRRQDAKLGDRILTTGHLGDSGAGLKALLENKPQYTELIKIHHNPSFDLREGVFLGNRAEVRAMMDISDGIGSDLKHILRASSESCGIQLGATIELDKLPMSDYLREALRLEPTWNAVELMLGSGEDYHLLLTVDQNNCKELQEAYYDMFQKPLFDIGYIDQSSGIKLSSHGLIIDNNGMDIVSGFTHF